MKTSRQREGSKKAQANMKHLANPNKVARINAVNRLYGWPLMRIHTPQEVLGL